MSEFERMRMKTTDTIDDFVGKLSELASKSSALGVSIEEPKLVKKFLNSLPRKKYIHIIAALEQVLDLNKTSFVDIVGRLKTYEERIRDEEDQEDDQPKLMYANNCQEGYDQGRNRGARGGRFAGRSRGRGRGNYQNRDKSQIVCYRCDKHGHYTSNCPDRLLKLQEIQDTDESENQDTEDLLMHEVVFLNEKKVHPKKFETKIAGDDVWYLDNGANNHMTGNRSYFTKLDETVTVK
ncbi:PREDICTED: uncharacterized protein LOC104772803 [Camelina sativa]|uniref:Uncharacterized protein LOC104772803 n=1 Tax=Camelina sativa TaxID=90675 RepID=A0ABM1RF90_CAMSA|nr:PREDICTED: uncharacterized protein LOC104772803 [Camelina sativa]